jgi:hypothetical protein
MNKIQMLNTWRLFTKEVFMSIFDDEIELPAWFWADNRASNWSFIEVDSQIMKRSIDCSLFALDYADDFPVYFILDKTQSYISYLDDDDEYERNYRTWLTCEENERK